MSAQHRIGYVFFGKGCQGARGRHFHFHVDGAGAHVQGAAEDEREAQDVVDLVGVIAAACAKDHVAARVLHIFVRDLRVRVRHGEDDGVARHAAHHVFAERIGR